MSALNDGGPAFPTTHERSEIVRSTDGQTLDKTTWSEARGGMTLRDYFAGQALAGIGISLGWEKKTDSDWDDSRVANYCYELAEAMLQARAKGVQS